MEGLSIDLARYEELIYSEKLCDMFIELFKHKYKRYSEISRDEITTILAMMGLEGDEV